MSDSTGERRVAPPMTPALRRYVAAVSLVGGAAVAASVSELPSTPHALEWALIAVAGVLAGTYWLPIPGLNVSISVSDTFFLALAMLFGPAPATVGMAIDSAMVSWRKKYGWRRVLFNTTGPPLSLFVGAQVFFWLAGVEPLADAEAAMGPLILPVLAMTVVWFALNSGLTSVAVALEAGSRIVEVWTRIATLYASYAAAASAAFCMVIVTRYAGLTAAAAVLPLVFIFHLTIRSWLGRLSDAQQHVAKLDRLYLSTVETLATAIEAKDGVTHDHIRRVQTYAVGLARALGVTDEPTLKALEAAALLHDTGKLAVPEHILNKPGKLTPAEFEQMKLHVDVGADILSAIDFPYPVVPIVRCHHESWDGSGYPRGIAGTEIPIGARILSVVDCFDALTSDRPYRRALSEGAAIAILEERRGTMYDPLVVDTFIRVLPEITHPRAGEVPHLDALVRISQAAAPAPAPPAPAADPRLETSEDLLALVSLARVTRPDSPLEDVLALAASYVRRVIGRGTCVLHLVEGQALIAAHAHGELAGELRGRTMRIGERLSGWVAAHRRTILNSDGRLDLGDGATGSAVASLCTPLLDGDAVVGVMTIYGSSPASFTDEQGRLAEMMAPHLARMIAIARSGRVQASPLQPRRTADAARDLRVVSSR